jgi:hypothetical protein
VKVKKQLTRRDRKNIARLNNLKFWKKRWKDFPEEQEMFRQMGTNASKTERQSRNEKLKTIIGSWPDSLTAPELKDRVKATFPSFYNPRSAINRIAKNGFLSFDFKSKRWTNLVRLQSP